jgi:hypothetical protein
LAELLWLQLVWVVDWWAGVKVRTDMTSSKAILFSPFHF